MPYFHIHGLSSCPNFAHAIVVAQYLSEKLPNFEFKKVEVATSEWGEHLLEINRDNKWYIMNSPLIWKEIHQWGGKRYLIGGLGEFWEYVYCYYGLESRIPKSELRKLAADNLKFFEEKKQQASERIKYVRIVSIMGASNNVMTMLLLNDLFNVPNLGKSEGLIVRLYDENFFDERKHKLMDDTAEYYNSQNIFGSQQLVYVVHSLQDTMDDCDLLIILEDFRPHPGQSEESAKKKCFAKMNCLSESIGTSKHRNLRIVVASPGPACFLATCLVEFCTSVRPSDIVVVAADEGLSYIRVVSEKTGIDIAKICAPPVWGFIGMHSFVDESQTVYKAEVCRPNNRSLTAPRGSTLPLGTIKSELRLMSYLITDHDDIVRVVEERRKKMNTALDRPAILGKIRSIISLLKLWYASNPSDDIISLGVCSDSSFDIPAGIVFSQPVILDAKSRWVPFTEFPLMNDNTRNKINTCVELTSQTLKKFGLLHHFCRDDVDICSNPDCQMTTDNAL